jgi:hypothetical protein
MLKLLLSRRNDLSTAAEGAVYIPELFSGNCLNIACNVCEPSVPKHCGNSFKYSNLGNREIKQGRLSRTHDRCNYQEIPSTELDEVIRTPRQNC